MKVVLDSQYLNMHFSKIIDLAKKDKTIKFLLPQTEVIELDYLDTDMARKCRETVMINRNLFTIVDEDKEIEADMLATLSLDKALTWLNMGKKLFSFPEEVIFSNTKYVNENENTSYIDNFNEFINKSEEDYLLEDFDKNYYYVLGNRGDNPYTYCIHYEKNKWHLLNNNINISKECKPRNIEQKIFINELKNDEKTIYRILSSFGTGKTFLSSNYAIEQVKEGKKIVIIPNNSTVENARETGYLKGDLLDKELSYLGGFIDIEGVDKVCEKVANEEIEIVSLSQIRGRSFENSIILVTEAQNLTKKHVKLLISRVGAGSKIIFDGDIKQTDKNVFREDNGLLALEKIKESEYADLYSDCQLYKTERSRTAGVADFI